MKKRFWRIACLVAFGFVAAAGIVGPVLAEDKPADPAKAEADVRDQIQKSPNDAALYFKLGNLLYDQGRRTEARQGYEKAIELKPDYVQALVNLGVVLNEEGNSAEALKQFDRAMALAPDDVNGVCAISPPSGGTVPPPSSSSSGGCGSSGATPAGLGALALGLVALLPRARRRARR